MNGREAREREETMNKERIWLCWSCSQQTISVETEAEMCRVNLRAFVLNQPTDRVPLAVFPNTEAFRAFALQIQDMRNPRHKTTPPAKED